MSRPEERTEAHIRSIEVVGGHARVALRLIELSKDSASDLDDYAELIETDPGLASRVLALVNSAWFAPEMPIHSVKRAVCTLGLDQVRAVALGHCVASLHKSMRLGADDGRALWAASLGKAFAARLVCNELRPGAGSEAFTCALLQDVGLALFVTLEPEAVSELLRGSARDDERAAREEVRRFGMTHAEAGARLARNLGLPEHLVDAVAEHHDVPPTGDDGATDAFALATHVASLLPHDPRCWNPAEMQRLERIVAERLPAWDSLEDFLRAVQDEIAATEGALGGDAEAPDLLECLAWASEEAARAAGMLVAQNSSLMNGADRLQEAVAQAEHAKRLAESRADQDPLTRLYNRSGWDRRAPRSLQRAAGTKLSIGMAFFDLDRFKEVNDRYGHEAGDYFLAEISERIRGSVRDEDLVCRWGGDEFVVLLQGAQIEDCIDGALRVKDHVEASPIFHQGVEMHVSLTCGLVVRSATVDPADLETLMRLADESLYRAKETERGSFVLSTAS